MFVNGHFEYLGSQVFRNYCKFCNFGNILSISMIVLREVCSKINVLFSENRQTMLFSATQSETTDALIKSAMKDDVQSINTNEDNDRATVEGLKQG